MSILFVSLVYLLIHLSSILYIDSLWKAVGYMADDFDRILVFLLAPWVVLIIIIKLFSKEEK